jgi:hypothetical protein
MSPIAKFEVIKKIVTRYRTAIKKYKSSILDEFCEICGYSRKYAIWKLNHYDLNKLKRKTGRPAKYNNPRIYEALKQIWITADFACGKRLKFMIPEWLPFIDLLDDEEEKLLLTMSASTIDRVLKYYRVKLDMKLRCSTKPGTLLRNSIPISGAQWNIQKPGYIEVDSVVHCGTSMAGDYACTVNSVDLASGWGEQRATFNLGGHAVLEKIKDIEKSLPFPLLGLDSDCGGEYINYGLRDYLLERDKPVEFTRSRPYKKNDNAHIEQKNWTHVRKLIGYARIDNPKAVELLNDLYKNEWSLFYNYFIPSFKLISKERIGSKVIKKHDKPKTPYQRLLESEFISEEKKQELRNIYETLNPFDLKKIIAKKLDNITRNSRMKVVKQEAVR